jgi:hypothetical protein
MIPTASENHSLGGIDKCIHNFFVCKRMNLEAVVERSAIDENANEQKA